MNRRRESKGSGTPRTDTARTDVGTLSARHLRFGWWSLLVFLLMGLVLEALHGFKIGWYLEVANTTRRFSWTLAHAHGTLLAVVNLVLGATMHRCVWSDRVRSIASTSLIASTILLPGGFFLGGLFPHEGDPGLGIFLVPIGGGLLAVSVVLAAVGCRRSPSS